VSLNLVLGQGAVGQVRTAADLRNGSPKRGWDGGAEVSQPSRTSDTCHTNDTRRRDGTPTLAMPRPPHMDDLFGTHTCAAR
jgi:hypothetical protein